MASHQKSRLRRRRRLVIGIGVAAVLAAAAVITFMPGLVAPWSRLNNEEEELDLFSGRARFTRYFLYCRIRQDVRGTPLSEALAAGGGPGSGERWVKVNVFQPGVSNSPHFIYHGAFFQIGELARYWETGNFDRKARAKTARQLLRVWRDGGSYHAARPYFEHLVEWIAVRDSDQPATGNDIPNDLADRSLAAYARGRGPEQ